MTATRIPIRFGGLKPLLVIVGLTPGRCYLDVGPDVVLVRMGWSFNADVPRASIRSVRRVERKTWSIGVHGWRGRWLVNGAAAPLVSIEIGPPVRAWGPAFRVRLRELVVSVDDPDAVIAVLSA